MPIVDGKFVFPDITIEQLVTLALTPGSEQMVSKDWNIWFAFWAEVRPEVMNVCYSVEYHLPGKSSTFVDLCDEEKLRATYKYFMDEAAKHISD